MTAAVRIAIRPKLDQWWIAMAYQVIEKIARQQAIVHVDDLIDAGLPIPMRPEDWKVPIERALRNGVIQRTVVTRLSRRMRSHTPWPVYFSQTYDPRG